MQIVVNGIMTAYEKEGQGKVVLLLHGWGSDKRVFNGLMLTLSKQYTCLAVDLPGFGASEPPPAAWSLDEFSFHVQALLLKLRIRQVHAIVGHSNGGAVAIRGLYTKTLQADKLVLLGSAGIRNKASVRKLALKVIARTGKVATYPLPVSVRGKLRERLYKTAGSDLLVVPHMQETFKKTISQDLQQDAAYLKLPVLLIYGAQDVDTPPNDGQRFNRLIHGSHLEIVPGAGHYVFLDEPHSVTRKIEAFLK